MAPFLQERKWDESPFVELTAFLVSLMNNSGYDSDVYKIHLLFPGVNIRNFDKERFVDHRVGDQRSGVPHVDDSLLRGDSECVVRYSIGE